MVISTNDLEDFERSMHAFKALGIELTGVVVETEVRVTVGDSG